MTAPTWRGPMPTSAAMSPYDTTRLRGTCSTARSTFSTTTSSTCRSLPEPRARVPGEPCAPHGLSRASRQRRRREGAMAERTDLLVIGAGPYAYSAASCARDHGIDTRVVGLPMSFWREQMPADMYLRSGPDWHLDSAGEHTFAAFFEDRGLSRAENDPVPIGVFLDHTDWFRAQ